MAPRRTGSREAIGSLLLVETVHGLLKPSYEAFAQRVNCSAEVEGATAGTLLDDLPSGPSEVGVRL